MSDAKAPPVIFDTRLLKLRRARAARRPMSFLLERCLDDAADRLMDVKRDFMNVLVFGHSDVETGLRRRLPQSKLGRITVCQEIDSLPENTNFNLVISLLRLQSENDLPGSMIQLRQKLQPDGLFIGAMFGGETLTELRHVFYKTDEVFLGGHAPHIYPMATHTQAGELLSRAGLNQPVIDTDRFAVFFSSLNKLISDLRDLGETNVLTASQFAVSTRKYKELLEKNYATLFSREDGKLRGSFEVLWLTGWAPHESQQKPLKPGSATVNLGEALNAIKAKKE